MNINIEEKELNDLVKAAGDAKVDELVDKELNNRVQNILFGRIDSIFKDYRGFEYMVEKHVRELVEERFKETNTDEQLDKAVENISSRLAYKLKESILDSVGYSLYIENDDDDDEEENE